MRTKKEFNIRLGEQIKKAREDARQTQEQFSENIEVSPQYVSDLERGVVGISLPTFAKACCCLGVSANQLLFGKSHADRTSVLADKCKNLTDEEFSLMLKLIDCYIEGINLKKRS